MFRQNSSGGQSRRYTEVVVAVAVAFALLCWFCSQAASSSSPAPRAVCASTCPAAQHVARTADAVPQINPFDNRELCEPVHTAVREYIVAVVEPFAVTGVVPSGGKLMKYRVMAAERSGFGSNAKGIATLLLAAILTRVPILLESDCPQLHQYFSSDVAIIAPVVPLNTGNAGRKCEHHIQKLEDLDFQANGTFAQFVEMFGGEDAMYCDRHLIHLFAKMNWALKASPLFNRVLSMKPRDISGCLLDRALTPKPRVQEQVDAALLPWTRAATRAIEFGRPVPQLLALQLRLGGKKVSWEDPARVGDMSIVDCLVPRLTALINTMLDMEKNGTVNGASIFVVVSSDSEDGFNQVTALVPKDRRIEFRPTVFAHTARSYRLDADVTLLNDDKVIVDFLLLAKATLHMFSRSAFGEVPAWMGSTYRRTFPALPRGVGEACGFVGGTTLSNTHRLCFQHNTNCAEATC